MQLHYPLNPTTGVEDPAQLPWSNGVPQTGQEGSFPPFAMCVETMTEIVNAILQGNLVPASSDPYQLTRVIRGGQLDFDATDTGTADAVLCQIGLPHTQVRPGLPFSFIKGPLDNTGTVVPTLTITDLAGNNAVSGQLLKKNGKALAAGDLPANSLITVRADANGNFRLIAAMLPSDVVQQIAANAPVQVKADATFWVRSDSTATAPDGSANDQAHAFPTIAAARDYVKNKFYFSSFNCIFRLGVAGNYAKPGPINGVPNWIVLGDPANPQSYNITGADAGALVNCIGSNGQIVGCTITNTGSSGAWVSVSNGTLSVSFVVFASSGQTVTGSVMSAGAFGTLTRGPGCSMNGCNAAAVMSMDGGRISVTAILTLVGSSTLSVAYVLATNGGTWTTSSTQGEFSVTAGASLSGVAWIANFCGVIQVNGANPNTYFPGGKNGSASNGGQCA